MWRYPNQLSCVRDSRRKSVARCGKYARRLRGPEQLESRQMLAGDVIELGPQTGFYDQPYVEVEFFDQTTGLGPYGSEFGMGIYKFNRFLLDTGANSVLSAKGPTADMVARGYRTEGDYRELGVAGYMEFDISAPYRVEATGTAGSSITLPRGEDGTRIMSSLLRVICSSGR